MPRAASTKIDLAVDDMVEAAAGQRHLDLELAFAGELFIAHQLLDRSLRRDADFLQESAHGQIEAFTLQRCLQRIRLGRGANSPPRARCKRIERSTHLFVCAPGKKAGSGSTQKV